MRLIRVDNETKRKGTTERIGLVTGDAQALKHVFQFMTEKTYEFPVPKDMAIINGDRHKQVRIDRLFILLIMWQTSIFKSRFLRF